jgi:uncharacterized protein YfaS (alpha-2-macroglobulin family)
VNRKTKIIAGIVVAIGIIAIVLLIIRNQRKHEVLKINPAFAKYISAYTSGLISSESTIKIRLASDFANPEDIGKPVDATLFKFSPAINGKIIWKDSRTIEFKPAEPLPSKKKFTAKFYLSKLLKVPSDLETFKFQFETMAQNFSVTVDNLKPSEKNTYKLIGTLTTADVADSKDVEKLLSAYENGNKLKIKWIHELDRKTHRFQTDSIVRKKSKGEIKLEWDGKPIDVDVDGSTEVKVPAINEFILTNFKVNYQPEQYVLLQFSDLLQEMQDLSGLIKIGTFLDLNYVIEDNEVRIYSSSKKSGEYKLTVEPNIKNNTGKELNSSISKVIRFEELKPAVRLVSSGVIMPNSNGLIFPFEAVNLKAVDVKIVKIFENNITQFLQVNNLEGEKELSRVAKTVFKKKVALSSEATIDYGSWNRFFLDLSELIKTEPGAIYKITIGFKKQYALYPCEGENNEDVEMEDVEAEINDDATEYTDSYYDYYYDDYYYDYDGGYNWNEKDDPCKSSYYNKSRNISKNFLASDLGLIAKKGSDGTMTFVVTNLIDTKPMSGVNLEVYDFQQQLIIKGETNGDGMATLKMDKKPFLVIAKKKDQRGYLKLDDGSSLSLSLFDVSGVSSDKGIKGFIYTERGVWRPGDSLHLMFILEDKQNTLPGNHPVQMELIDPKGQISKKMIKSASEGGFYNFSTATNPNDPTGNWTLNIRVGSSTFSKTLKIETIMPNRLKINLDFGTTKLTKEQSDKAGLLTVKWLHGAVGKNLRANVMVTLSPTVTSFKNYNDYIFDDPTRKFSSENKVIFNSTTDENGNADVLPDIQVENAAPGVLNANFVVRVFEESGAFSSDNFSMPYYPYNSFVGIQFPKGDKYSGMLFTDTNNIIKIANVNAEGVTLASNEVKVEVYKVSWKWWWDNSYESFSNYESEYYNKPIQKEMVKIVNGKGKFNLRINYPDWGRYLVRVIDQKSGHATGKVVYIDWPGWASRQSTEKNAAATMLTFTVDKDKYNVGEEVKLTIPSSGKGRALISIETGSKVLKSYWKEVSKGSTDFSFPVTAEMAPNVFVNVTLLQPHSQTENDLPIRLYGILPVLVEDPMTHLRPVLTMPNILKPEETANISVKEENGKEMVYTIAMVDEGLLDLTHFITPDPWAFFYAREALGVKTWDMFDFVMGAYGGKLERILAIGGGDDGGSKDGTKANRFKPMVRFIGPFTLKKGETKNHKISMPQYVGSVRTMVIAGYKGAYGSADKTTPVRKPLMILGTLPRVVGPGETVKLPVDVFAMENFVKNVSVEISTNNLFTIVGSSKKTVSFKQVGDEMVNFELKVKSTIGVGKVSIIAKSGNQTAKYDIEIDIRNPNPKISKVIEAVIEPNITWNTDFVPIGMLGTNKGTIEVSSIPPINLSNRLRYLIDYPHGCIEQTTSSVFPQLYLSELMNVSNELKGKIETNVKAGILRLKSFQVSGGGLSYWPGNYQADEWGTSYAGHFLLEAEKKGYTLPYGLIENWKKYQKNKALSWTPLKNIYWDNELVQAYRLYTLALAKAPELGAMNNLREKKDLSIQSKWRLAAAYQLSGQTEVAMNIIKNIGTTVLKYSELSYTYGSSERDEAMILEALSLMNLKSKAVPVMKMVSEALSSNQWMSTQTTAYCLLGISKFVGNSGTTKELKYSYKINNGKTGTENTKSALSQVDMKLSTTNSGSVELKNLTNGIIYVRIVLEGIPEAGEETSSESNLKMSITYKTLKGQLIDPTKLEQGTDFIAEVKIINPGSRGSYKEMALTQIFPSGWEIHNARMDGMDVPIYSSTPTYQDIRDDRVYTYFNINANESKTFTFMLNASYIGKYYLPMLYCEAMYDASINSKIAGKWVEVVEGK